MRRFIGGAVLLLSLMVVGSAEASSLRGETITTTLYFPTFPSSAPYVAQYSGTFTASGPVTDAGSISAQTLLGAVRSPSVANLHTTQTLTGSQGTLVLRCEQIAKVFTNPSATPSTGTCTILSGTGAYANAHGSAKLTGLTDFTANPVTVTNIVTF